MRQESKNLGKVLDKWKTETDCWINWNSNLQQRQKVTSLQKSSRPHLYYSSRPRKEAKPGNSRTSCNYFCPGTDLSKNYDPEREHLEKLINILLTTSLKTLKTKNLVFSLPGAYHCHSLPFGSPFPFPLLPHKVCIS